MNTRAIGSRIKAAREHSGMTQEELAEILDFSPVHVSAIERGVKSPRLETFVKIANTLAVSPDTLLQDVAEHASDGVDCELSCILAKLSGEERRRILNAVRALVE